MCGVAVFLGMLALLVFVVVRHARSACFRNCSRRHQVLQQLREERGRLQVKVTPPQSPVRRIYPQQFICHLFTRFLQLSILDIVRVTNKDALKRIAHLESSLAGLIMFCTFRRASHPLSSRHNVCDFNAAAETALSRLSVLAQRLLAHTHALLEIKHFTQRFIDITNFWMRKNLQVLCFAPRRGFRAQLREAHLQGQLTAARGASRMAPNLLHVFHDVHAELLAGKDRKLHACLHTHHITICATHSRPCSSCRRVRDGGAGADARKARQCRDHCGSRPGLASLPCSATRL